jgi:hypothetical protein
MLLCLFYSVTCIHSSISKQTVDVVSSDTCVKNREKHDGARSIPRMNTMSFILFQILLRSNSHTSSFLLYYDVRFVAPDEL